MLRNQVHNMPIPKEILAVERPKSTVVKFRLGRYLVVKRTSKRVNGKAKPVDLGTIGEIIDGKRISQEIKDELKERGMTQKQLAVETGIKASVLSETINGKRSVSLNVAVALEKAFDIPADIWMNMQTQYDLDTANITKRDSQRETVAVTIPIRDHNLLQELVRKFGWACVF